MPTKKSENLMDSSLEKEDEMPTTYQDPKTGWLYRVSPKADDRGDFCIEYLDAKSSSIYKPCPNKPKTILFGTVAEVLTATAKREGWVEMNIDDFDSRTPADGPCAGCLCNTCANEDCDPAPGCYVESEFCDRIGNTKECDRYQPRPTSSDVPIVAAEQTAEAPEPAALDNTMVASAAPHSAETDDATDCTLASSGGSAVAAFDYSELDENTAQIVHDADAIMQQVRRNYIFETARAVNMAHDALSSHYGGTFGKWCASYGMSRETANKLMQVVNLIDNSSREEQAILEQAPATLLYAAAKPSAPAELVQAVKTGDIKSMPEYKALLEDFETERAARKKAEVLVGNYRSTKDAALANAELRQREADEARRRLDEAKQHIAELESRPIETVVADSDELDRRAVEKAKSMTAMYKAQVSGLMEELGGYRSQEDDQSAVQYNIALTLAKNAAEALYAACRGFWAVAKNLTDDDLDDASAPIIRACDLVTYENWEDNFEEEDDNEQE